MERIDNQLQGDLMTDEFSLTHMHLESGCFSHTGMGRKSNEDAICRPQASNVSGPRGLLWAVADGMGGHRGGKVASRLACRLLQTYFDRTLKGRAPHTVQKLRRHLLATVMRIDRSVRRAAQARKPLEDMGTTLSCLLLTQGHSIIAHVGDSRIYRLRDGHLSCLTTDHTFVQEMIFEGEVEPGNAHLHPLRHLLMHAIGAGEPLCHVDDRIDRIRAGDRFLLCTDGLHNVLGPGPIAALLAVDGRSRDIAQTLVAEALRRKTNDNVTAVVVALSGHAQDF
jgi:PPM family protein phosphatase